MLSHIKGAGFVHGPAEKAKASGLHKLKLLGSHQLIHCVINHPSFILIIDIKLDRNLLIIHHFFRTTTKKAYDQCCSLFSGK